MKKKKEKKTIPIIELNSFKAKFDWSRNIISIEIDQPLQSAAKTSLVFDSTTRLLYRFINGTWMALNAFSIDESNRH